MQALKEILDNALLLSKKPINMVYFIKDQTFLREYFELSFEFLTIAIVFLLYISYFSLSVSPSPLYSRLFLHLLTFAQPV